MTNLKPTKGKLLVAEPSIFRDRPFNRSVVLLTSHDLNGSVGFIFNKPLEFNLKDILPELNSEFPLFNGGPVAKSNLYYVHSVPNLIPDSEKIGNNLFWGGNFDTVKQLLIEGKLKNEDIRFFLGYSGWQTKQLEEELDTESWLVIKNNYQNIFTTKPSSFWKNELKRIGGDYLMWANAPENPSLN